MVNKLPGGEIIHGVVGSLRDQGWDTAIDQWNPKPDPAVVKFPSAADVSGGTQGLGVVG